jgi:hypothetical protein
MSIVLLIEASDCPLYRRDTEDCQGQGCHCGFDGNKAACEAANGYFDTGRSHGRMPRYNRYNSRGRGRK